MLNLFFIEEYVDIVTHVKSYICALFLFLCKRSYEAFLDFYNLLPNA